MKNQIRVLPVYYSRTSARMEGTRSTRFSSPPQLRGRHPLVKMGELIEDAEEKKLGSFDDGKAIMEDFHYMLYGESKRVETAGSAVLVLDSSNGGHQVILILYNFLISASSSL